MKNSANFRLYALLGTATVLYFFANFQRAGVPGTIFDQLQSTLGLSATAVSGLSSAFMYIYAFGQLIAGYNADRFGGVRVIACGGVLFAAGSLLFPFCDTLFGLYFSRALVGLGASAIYLSMVKEIARNFPGKFTLFLGTYLFIGYSGTIFATVPLLQAVEALGSWQLALKLAGAVILAVYIVYFLLKLTVPPIPIEKQSFNLMPFVKYYQKRHNLLLSAYGALFFGIYYSLQIVAGQKYLTDFCQMSAMDAAAVLSGMGILAAITNCLIAVLSRLCGNRRKIFILWAGYLGLGSLLILLVSAIFDWRSPYLAGCLLIFSVVANIAPITTSLAKETNRPENLGVTVSTLNCLSYLAVAVLGNCCGMLLDVFEPSRQGEYLVYSRNSYLLLFAVLSAICVIPVVCSFFLKETRGQDCSETTF